MADGFTGEEVVVSDDFVFFWKPPATFSQWTPSAFTVDGVDYGCAEQLMMAEKARLFDDAEMLGKILGTSSPKQQKALGRKVRGFDDDTWESARLDIVIRANLAKFGQNEAMRQELFETGERTLVEASPLDRIWGIGLRGDDARIYDPDQWRGLNLLGQALTAVRDQLRAEASD